MLISEGTTITVGGLFRGDQRQGLQSLAKPHVIGQKTLLSRLDERCSYMLAIPAHWGNEHVPTTMRRLFAPRWTSTSAS